MYNATFERMMSDILGVPPQFALTAAKQTVTVFNCETGEQKYCHEFDNMQDADTYARHITRHEGLCARLTSSDSLIVYLYDDGAVSSSWVDEVGA